MIEFFTNFLIVAAVIYVADIVFLYIGLRKNNHPRTESRSEPTVSIIVAARNEEHHIEECLSSLVQVDYPQEKIEVIVVNDRSTDRTPAIIEKFSRRFDFVKMVVTEPDEGNLRGKTNAVASGIAACHGEILMFTDADCTVPRQWVRETVASFDETTGIVGGFTLLEASRTFEGIQALDWIYLFGMSASAANWGIPLTAVGNNLSVRRSAYDATGGYKGIPFSVTEDYSLVRSILQKTSFKLLFPVSENALVRSKACQNWLQLYRQKQRWGVGGLDMVATGFLLTSLGWLLKFALVIGALTVSWHVWLAAFLAKTLVDALFVYAPLRKFHALHYMKYLPAFEIYFTVYVLVLPFVAMISKDVLWKERRL